VAFLEIETLVLLRYSIFLFAVDHRYVCPLAYPWVSSSRGFEWSAKNHRYLCRTDIKNGVIQEEYKPFIRTISTYKTTILYSCSLNIANASFLLADFITR